MKKITQNIRRITIIYNIYSSPIFVRWDCRGYYSNCFIACFCQKINLLGRRSSCISFRRLMDCLCSRVPKQFHYFVWFFQIFTFIWEEVFRLHSDEVVQCATRRKGQAAFVCNCKDLSNVISNEIQLSFRLFWKRSLYYSQSSYERQSVPHTKN